MPHILGLSSYSSVIDLTLLCSHCVISTLYLVKVYLMALNVVYILVTVQCIFKKMCVPNIVNGLSVDSIVVKNLPANGRDANSVPGP